MSGLAVESNAAAFKKALDATAKRLLIAQAIALTKTAKDVQSALRPEMNNAFDRPTRWTLNSTFVRPATVGNLISTVGFKDFAPKGTPAGKYLMPQVHGGARPHKRFERWLIGKGIMSASEFCVPGPAARLDGAGNWSGSHITAILSQLQASPDAYQWETRKSRARAGRKRARVFVPGRGSHLRRGIWMRDGRTVRPIAFFVSSTSYAPRFPFHRIAHKHAVANFPIRYREQMERTFRR